MELIFAYLCAYQYTDPTIRFSVQYAHSFFFLHLALDVLFLLRKRKTKPFVFSIGFYAHEIRTMFTYFLFFLLKDFLLSAMIYSFRLHFLCSQL